MADGIYSAFKGLMMRVIIYNFHLILPYWLGLKKKIFEGHTAGVE
jgi:hypothetical protein